MTKKGKGRADENSPLIRNPWNGPNKHRGGNPTAAGLCVGVCVDVVARKSRVALVNDCGGKK